jgi:DNA-3-methyladenine glycosylase
MRRLITAEEVQSSDTPAIARWLVGKVLATAGPAGVERRRIVETEAYHGPDDLACHASKGRTARTAVMFQPGGCWYVYLVYGMHEMLNLVTGPADFPAAVLIRSVVGVAGPGRLTKALGIDRRFNGRPAAVATGLWLEEGGIRLSEAEVLATPRVGIDYAGPIWRDKPWRYLATLEAVAAWTAAQAEG